MKKLISTVLAAALTLSLAACGSTAASSTSEAASGSEAASTASSETASDASDAVDFTGDGYDATVDYASLAGTTIKVAASPVPHAEILKVAGDIPALFVDIYSRISSIFNLFSACTHPSRSYEIISE